jgi:hypothetical protein
MAVLSGGTAFSAAALGAAAIGGAVGSLASQAFAVGVGLQEKINWKGVALSAVGSMVTAGIGSYGAFTIPNSPTLSAGLNAAAGNVASQGLAIAFKQQDKFNWRSVAAAGVGAAVGNEIGDLFKGSQYAGGMIEKGITAGATSITSQLINTGKVDWRSVGAGAFEAVAAHEIKGMELGGVEKAFAEGLVGAGAAAIRKQNVLAGAFVGVANSYVAQHELTGATKYLAQGLIGAGTAKMNRQDVVAGFIGGGVGTMVGDYLPTVMKEVGVDPMDVGQPRESGKEAAQAWARATELRDSVLNAIAGDIGSGVAKAVANWAGRDMNVAGMIGSGAASQAYNATVQAGREEARKEIDDRKRAAAQQAAHRSSAATFAGTVPVLEASQLAPIEMPGVAEAISKLPDVTPAATPDLELVTGGKVSNLTQAFTKFYGQAPSADDLIRLAQYNMLSHPDQVSADRVLNAPADLEQFRQIPVSAENHDWYVGEIKRSAEMRAALANPQTVVTTDGITVGDLQLLDRAFKVNDQEAAKAAYNRTLKAPDGYVAPDGGRIVGVEPPLNLVGRFARGAVHGAVDIVWQPVANVIDLGQVVVGLASGGNYEPTWLSGIGKNYQAGMSYGETVTRAVLGSNPVTGVGMASYDLTSSAHKNDWGGVAEGTGGLVGGFVAGKYGQRVFAPEPGAQLGFYRVGAETEMTAPGVDPLPAGHAPNFTKAAPVDLGGKTLSRVFDNVKAYENGGYWGEEIYTNETSWRSGMAVPERANWNNGTLQGTWNPTSGRGWGGPAAPQGVPGFSTSKFGFKFGWIQLGGDYQIYVPNSRNVITPGSVVTRPAPWRQ